MAAPLLTVAAAKRYCGRSSRKLDAEQARLAAERQDPVPDTTKTGADDDDDDDGQQMVVCMLIFFLSWATVAFFLQFPAPFRFLKKFVQLVDTQKRSLCVEVVDPFY